MTNIIAVTSDKGGVGKSKVSMVSAAALASMGRRVLVVDSDKTGTSTRWAASAPETRPFPATVVSLAHAQGKLPQLIKPMLGDYDYIVIDCPPSLENPATQSSLLIADVALVPLQATPADLWATQDIAALIDRARVLNPDLKAFAVANRVRRRKLASQVLDVMREGELELLRAQLGDRGSFQEALVRGSSPTLMGAAHKDAAAEVKALVAELLERMGWQ